MGIKSQSPQPRQPPRINQNANFPKCLQIISKSYKPKLSMSIKSQPPQTFQINQNAHFPKCLQIIPKLINAKCEKARHFHSKKTAKTVNHSHYSQLKPAITTFPTAFQTAS